MSPPLVTLTDATVTFGGRPAFTDVTLALGADDRVCLVGRNGSGKSTLLRALAGELEVDGGSRFLQPGTKLAFLSQEPRFGRYRTAQELVEGTLPADIGAAGPARAAALLAAVQLDGDAELASLSGGEARRADLARVLAMRADVLMLDEPTNHLDIETILWLEGELQRFRGAIVMISHDRAFLSALSRRLWWLDRGQLRRIDRGYDAFDEWAEQTLAAEEQAAHRDARRLISETKWLREGLSARRKRNEGRVRNLLALRQSLANREAAPGQARMAIAVAEGGGSLALEAEHVSHGFGDRVILKDFSLRLPRGARLALIGPNGVGKTTLIRILTGQLAPDQGRVRLGVGLETAYFDQRRAALDPEASLAETLTEGSGDQIMVDGRPRHVVSYLKDFLFTDIQARSPVKALSGGERARLLLAKLFARPSNLLVLDEPTNDLDMDSLDLLQDLLAEYPGTALLVSHDRDFLDRVATATLALEGDGQATLYAGGYSDYLIQRRDSQPAATRTISKAPAGSGAAQPAQTRAPARRLTYRDERERQALPDKIAALEGEIAGLDTKLADPGLYQRNPADFARHVDRAAAARAELAAAEERWLELEILLSEVQAGSGG